MYAKAIVGFDGRSGGDDAQALASALVGGHGQVVLAQVGDGDSDASSGSARVVKIAARSVGEGLRRVAERQGGELIVVGSCQRNALERVVAGDDARSVLHRAVCPVAIAPTGYGTSGRAIRTVGVAYNGSSESMVAVAHAGLLAAQLGVGLIALSVVAPPMPTVGWGMSGGYLIDQESQLAEARERLGTLDGVELEFVIGTIYDELTAFSERVDLIVCGSRHHNPAARIVLGSSGDHLARHAGCPLLVTPVADEAAVTRWREQRDAAVA
jgi:nucleotide-binding universal stress UspA family protein